MSTRKNTKFNKNNGYKDFSISKNKPTHEQYAELQNSVNLPDYNLPFEKK